MIDLNWDQKVEMSWSQLKDATYMRDWRTVQKNYWRLYHLYKQKLDKQKEIDVIEY